MISNQGMMVQSGLGPNQVQVQVQPPPQIQQQQTIPTPAAQLQARVHHNEEILARCLVQTQRLRENIQALLNVTKQAANIDTDESSTTTAASTGTNSSWNSALKSSIDRKLYDMSASLDQIATSLDQYDFKILSNQQLLGNHYYELSYEKQGTVMDEWSTNARWMEKLTEIGQLTHSYMRSYRRSAIRNPNPSIRSRFDGPSSAHIDRIISQFDAASASQSALKEYSISVQRLSDHLNIIEMSLHRSGLDIYLYVRHCTVENIIVKPLNEKRLFGNNLNSKLTTNYRGLDIIAGHLRAAAVYYTSSTPQPDQSLFKLLVYINKYQGLNSQKCTNCQKHLLNGLQPTWRDLKSYDCYHEECLN